MVKNSAYGMGDSIVGPLLASCREIGGVACVRPAEALAMRTAGVRIPILLMSEASEDEGVELARQDVTLSCWLDDAAECLERVAGKARKTVSVLYYVDTGMNREGKPWRRAIPWMQQIAQRRGIRVDGTYQMCVHELEVNRIQLQRFTELIDEAKSRGVRLGALHAAPTFELYRMPEAHLDMVRVGNALFGADPVPDYRSAATLQPVFPASCGLNASSLARARASAAASSLTRRREPSQMFSKNLGKPHVQRPEDAPRVTIPTLWRTVSRSDIWEQSRPASNASCSWLMPRRRRKDRIRRPTLRRSSETS